MPFVTSVERLAKEEGRTEGRTAGRTEGLNEGLVRMFAGRHGPLRKSLERRIRALPAQHLERLAEHAFSLTTLDDLKAWLDEAEDKA